MRTQNSSMRMEDPHVRKTLPYVCKICSYGGSERIGAVQESRCKAQNTPCESSTSSGPAAARELCGQSGPDCPWISVEICNVQIVRTQDSQPETTKYILLKTLAHLTEEFQKIFPYVRKSLPYVRTSLLYEQNAFARVSVRK